MSSSGVVESWERIEAWLGEHAPRTLATLNGPAGPAAIAEAERAVGVEFPADLKASLARHDGAGEDGTTLGRLELAGGYGLMSLDQIVGNWRSLTEILESLGEELEPGDWWHPRWIPVADFCSGDHLIIDARPGRKHGQVGVFYSHDVPHLGQWKSFAALLGHTADLLEGQVTDDEAVPRTESGRLVWRWVDERAENPRSVLALAAAARRGDGTGPAVVIEPLAPEPSDGPDWIVDRRGCLTFARGLTENELISRFGGSPEDTTDRTAEDAIAYADSWRSGYRPVIRVGRTGAPGQEWAFAFETRIGAREQGLREEVVRRVSAGTRVVSVGFDGISTELAYAEDGVVVGRFDSRWPSPVEGTGPGGLQSRLEEAGLLPVEHERYVEDDAVAAVALAVSLGPGAFDPRVLRGPLRAAALLPLLEDARTEPRPGPVELDPELVTAIAYATEEQLRPAVIALARRRAAEAGLDGHPDIATALRDAAQPPRESVPDDSALGVLMRTLHAEAYAGRQTRQDAGTEDLLTEPERAAWDYRSAVAEAIQALLTRPAAVAAHLLVNGTTRFDPRQALLDDLAGVTIPDDGAERLVRAEERLREDGYVWPGPRPSRRDAAPG
jgi:cell wall assembly regulator SMI1